MLIRVTISNSQAIWSWHLQLCKRNCKWQNLNSWINLTLLELEMISNMIHSCLGLGAWGPATSIDSSSFRSSKLQGCDAVLYSWYCTSHSLRPWHCQHPSLGFLLRSQVDPGVTSVFLTCFTLLKISWDYIIFFGLSHHPVTVPFVNHDFDCGDPAYPVVLVDQPWLAWTSAISTGKSGCDFERARSIYPSQSQSIGREVAPALTLLTSEFDSLWVQSKL